MVPRTLQLWSLICIACAVVCTYRSIHPLVVDTVGLRSSVPWQVANNLGAFRTEAASMGILDKNCAARAIAISLYAKGHGDLSLCFSHVSPGKGELSSAAWIVSELSLVGLHPVCVECSEEMLRRSLGFGDGVAILHLSTSHFIVATLFQSELWLIDPNNFDVTFVPRSKLMGFGWTGIAIVF